MVEPNDNFGSSPPPPEGHEGPGYGEPRPEGALGEPASTDFASSETYGSHPAEFKHPHAAPQVSDETAHHPVFPIIVGAALLLTLVIAWIANRSPATSETKPAETAGSTATPTASAAPAATPEPIDDSKTLKAEIDGLQTDLKTLQARIEAMPKATAAPDLAPLNAKIDAIAKDTESLSALPKKVEDLDHRVGSFDKAIVALRGEVDTLKGDVKKAAEPAPAAPASESAKPEDVAVSNAAMEQAVGLFKSGKYKEASDAFQKLTETLPDDARVWYYAALSRGSATKEWTGDTAKLVDKAVQREKAGTPDSSKIDAVFADLNPAFKPWLDAYRKMARAR
jgi:TolA-binding protein